MGGGVRVGDFGTFFVRPRDSPPHGTNQEREPEAERDKSKLVWRNRKDPRAPRVEWFTVRACDPNAREEAHYYCSWN